MAFIVNEKIEEYVKAHSTKPDKLLDELYQKTHDKMELPQMLTGPIEGRLLKFLIQMMGARRVLEIGTFTGYATLNMAQGLPEDGELVTCELEDRHAKFAQSYFDRSDHGKKIQIKKELDKCFYVNI